MGVGEEGAGRGLLRGDEPLGCPWLRLALLTISEGWAEAERGPARMLISLFGRQAFHLKPGKSRLGFWQTP